MNNIFEHTQRRKRITSRHNSESYQAVPSPKSNIEETSDEQPNNPEIFAPPVNAKRPRRSRGVHRFEINKTLRKRIEDDRRLIKEENKVQLLFENVFKRLIFAPKTKRLYWVVFRLETNATDNTLLKKYLFSTAREFYMKISILYFSFILGISSNRVVDVINTAESSDSTKDIN